MVYIICGFKFFCSKFQFQFQKFQFQFQFQFQKIQFQFNSNSIIFSNKQFQFQFQFRNWNWNCPSIPIPELNWPHVWKQPRLRSRLALKQNDCGHYYCWSTDNAPMTMCSRRAVEQTLLVLEFRLICLSQKWLCLIWSSIFLIHISQSGRLTNNGTA